MTPTVSPPRLHPTDEKRIHRAAFYVTRLHPGPKGDVLSEYMTVYAEFGYRLGHSATVVRLVEQVLEEWEEARREGKVA